ncbi:hypothetical protein ACFQU2_22575 [Siccirubricoccus deserti]
MKYWLGLAALFVALTQPAAAQQVLRIGMTASDVPTTSGMPDNGFEGMRFLGYPVFEALTLWDLSRSDVRAGLRPGLAERWEQDPGIRRPGSSTCARASPSTTARPSTPMR